MSLNDRLRDARRQPEQQDDEHRAHRQRAREGRRPFMEEVRPARERLQEERRERSHARTPVALQPIWLRLREPRGRGRNALSYEQIVDAAIALADTEGPKAITMRKIAQALGVGTMSLYWYVPSKDDLLELMLDEIYGEGEPGEPTGDWRADLAAGARARRRVMLRHPWLLTHIGVGPPRGPNALRGVERALAALDPVRLDPGMAMGVIMAVDTFVTGFVLREQLEDQESEVKAGFANASEEEIRVYIDRLFASGQYPHLEAVIRGGIDPDDPATRDARFEFGLSCLLDGIAARIGRE